MRGEVVKEWPGSRKIRIRKGDFTTISERRILWNTMKKPLPGGQTGKLWDVVGISNRSFRSLCNGSNEGAEDSTVFCFHGASLMDSFYFWFDCFKNKGLAY